VLFITHDMYIILNEEDSRFLSGLSVHLYWSRPRNNVRIILQFSDLYDLNM
jgi:hypothetical protein